MGHFGQNLSGIPDSLAKTWVRFGICSIRNQVGYGIFGQIKIRVSLDHLVSRESFWSNKCPGHADTSPHAPGGLERAPFPPEFVSIMWSRSLPSRPRPLKYHTVEVENELLWCLWLTFLFFLPLPSLFKDFSLKFGVLSTTCKQNSRLAREVDISVIFSGQFWAARSASRLTCSAETPYKSLL